MKKSNKKDGLGSEDLELQKFICREATEEAEKEMKSVLPSKETDEERIKDIFQLISRLLDKISPVTCD